MKPVTLYRPVGPEELELIKQSAWKRCPTRPPEQPISYPVVQEAYAVRIARDWNTKSSGVGLVTKFNVARDYLNSFEVHTLGVAGACA